MTASIKKPLRRIMVGDAPPSQEMKAVFKEVCVNVLGFSKPWDMDDPAAPWFDFGKKLFTLVTSKPKPRKKPSLDDHQKVYAAVTARMDFYGIDVDGEESGKKLRLKVALGDYAVKHKITDSSARYSYETVQKNLKSED